MNAAETEITEAIDRWIQALKDRDLQRLFADYDASIILFDVKPPFQLRGVPAIRAMWEECLPCFPETFGYERRDVRIFAGTDLAVAHWIFRITGWPDDHPGAGMWFRATLAFRQTQGRWLAIHEHVSAPFDPMTGRVVSKLEDE